MNNIQSNTGRISELANSIQSLTLDLEEAMPLDHGQKVRLLSLSNAVNSIDESIGNEAEKIDQLCLEQAKTEPSNEEPGSPVVVSLNTNKEDQRSPALSPAWYQYGLNGDIDNMMLIDSLTLHFDEVDAIGDLMMSVDQSQVNLSRYTLNRVGWMLRNQAREAKSLVERWWEAKKDTKQ